MDENPTGQAGTVAGERAEIVLGAMEHGSRIDEERSRELLDRFVELGGRWIDTADCYAFWLDPRGVGGASEEALGRWLRDRPGVRDAVRISTKVRQQPLVPHRWPESAEGLSAGAIRAGVRGSLDRLGLDAVDLLWAHAEDRSVPLEETVAAFGELAAAGVAARLGASNHAAWRVERARTLAAGLGVPAWTALQLRHTYLQPLPGVDLEAAGHVLMSPESLDLAAAVPGTAVWAYTPLLGGGYVRDDRLHRAYDHPGTARRLTVLDGVVKETGATRNQVVLAWLIGGSPPVSPIIGTSRVEQLDEAMAARDLALDADQRARLDAAA